jgi:signal transduction histidine kinase
MHTEEENKILTRKVALLENDLKTMRSRMQNLQSIILSNISHDIRTPMNAIVGFANLLTNDQMDKKDRIDCVEQINSNSNELLEIIDNMIDASLLQCGDIKLNEKECPLNDLMDGLYENFKKSYDLRQKGLNLIVSKGEDNDYFVVADYKRLSQVIANLVGNAVKFTDTGYVEFGYERERNKTVRFFVKDTGIGLSPLSDDDLFKPFRSRTCTGNSNTKKGAGLGLTVSKKLIELMGGAIWQESTPGKGTSFYFTIPEKRHSYIRRKLNQIGTGAKRNIASLL